MKSFLYIFPAALMLTAQSSEPLPSDTLSRLRASISDYRNLIDLGGKGDSTGVAGSGTDNTAALLRARTACSNGTAAHPRRIFIPSGTYRITQYVNFDGSGCWLDGENKGGTTLLIDPPRHIRSGLGFDAPSAYQSENRLTNVVIEAADSTKVDYPLSVTNQNRWYADNVHIVGGLNAVRTAGMQVSTWNNVRTTGALGDCVYYDATRGPTGDPAFIVSTSTAWSHSYFGGCGGDGVVVNHAASQYFDHDVFEGNGCHLADLAACVTGLPKFNSGRAIDVGRDMQASAVVSDSHVEANRSNPFHVGVGSGNSASRSELILRDNVILAEASGPLKMIESPACVVVADWASVVSANIFAYNPNVFSAGWIKSDLTGQGHTLFVQSDRDPAGFLGAGQYPIVTDSTAFYGQASRGNFRAAAYASRNTVTTEPQVSSDLQEDPGVQIVVSKTNPTIHTPISFLDGQDYTLRVENNNPIPLIVTFTQAFEMHPGNVRSVPPRGSATYSFHEEASAGRSYSFGTISSRKGSASIVGVGTDWSPAMAGGTLSVDGVRPQPIAAIVDRTHLTLVHGSQGSFESAQRYSIEFGAIWKSVSESPIATGLSDTLVLSPTCAVTVTGGIVTGKSGCSH